MSDSIHISRRSLTFAANTASYATKFGLKKGAQKAATKVNPTLLVIEAGISVANAVQSFYQVKEAKAVRDGLEDYIPKVKKRLEVERKALIEQAKILKAELELKKEQQAEITKFVLLTMQFYSDAASEIKKVKDSDIIDAKELDQKEKELAKQWRSFQKALRIYTEIIN